MEKQIEKLKNSPPPHQATQLVNEELGFKPKFKSDGRVLVLPCSAGPSTFPLCPKQPDSCRLSRLCQSPSPGLCSLPSALASMCQGEGRAQRVMSSHPGSTSFITRGFCGRSICWAFHPRPSLSLAGDSQCQWCVSPMLAAGHSPACHQGRGRARRTRSILFSH